MSFFKDFKDDLSQAVNELMPEEGAAGAPQMVDTISESAAPIGQDDLAELIKGLDEADAAPAAEPMFEAPKEPEPVAPAPEPAPAVAASAIRVVKHLFIRISLFKINRYKDSTFFF